jgi:hypothetical protein
VARFALPVPVGTCMAMPPDKGAAVELWAWCAGCRQWFLWKRPAAGSSAERCPWCDVDPTVFRRRIPPDEGVLRRAVLDGRR